MSSGTNIEDPSTEKPSSLVPPSLAGVDQSLLSPKPPQSVSPELSCLPNSAFQISDIENLSDYSQTGSDLLPICPPPHPSFGELQSAADVLPVNTLSNLSVTPHNLTLPSNTESPLTGDQDVGTFQLSTNLQGSEGQRWPPLALSTFTSPNLNDLISSQVSLCSTFSHCSGTPPSTEAEATGMDCSDLESPSQSSIQKESLSKGSGVCSGTDIKVGGSSLALLFYENNPNTSFLVLESLPPLATKSLKDTTSETNLDVTGPVRSTQDSHDQDFSKKTWNSLPRCGNSSVVEEDMLQMSSSEALTLQSEEVCTPTETETNTLLRSPQYIPAQHELEESRKVQQTDMNVSETPKSLLVCPSIDLIEIDSLDVVFQANDPELESENVEAFFHDVSVEGLVYWAEPIKVLSPNHTHEDSQSQEASNGLLGTEPLALSTGRLVPLSLPSVPSTGTDHTPARDAPSSLTSPPSPSSSRDISLQMSLPPASHIVHRKDIPYVTNSTCTRLPSVLPLDTSTPFRAVQSWTDLHIKQNILTNMFMQGLFHTIPKRAIASKSAPETTQSHKVAQNCFTGMTRNNCSMSDPGPKGLWPDEEVDTPGSEGENHVQDHRLVNMTSHCTCCCCRPQDSYNIQKTLGKSDVSNSVYDAAVILTLQSKKQAVMLQ